MKDSKKLKEHVLMDNTIFDTMLQSIKFEIQVFGWKYRFRIIFYWIWRKNSFAWFDSGQSSRRNLSPHIASSPPLEIWSINTQSWETVSERRDLLMVDVEADTDWTGHHPTPITHNISCDKNRELGH